MNKDDHKRCPKCGYKLSLLSDLIPVIGNPRRRLRCPNCGTPLDYRVSWMVDLASE